LVIAKVPVFLGSQADVLFHTPFSSQLRRGTCRLILSSSAFSHHRVGSYFRSVVRQVIPLPHAFGYAEHIVLFNRVCRATLRSLFGFCFTRRRSLWANPSFQGTLRDEAAHRP
jgi:hypothetical protein